MAPGGLLVVALLVPLDAFDPVSVLLRQFLPNFVHERTNRVVLLVRGGAVIGPTKQKHKREFQVKVG